MHEELLSVIFRLVNFGVLLFVCAYFFRRYILPDLQAQMVHEEQESIRIQERHREIEHQEKSVENFSQSQKKLCSLLQEKVNCWHAVYEKTVQHQEQEKKERMTFLQKKIKQQELVFAQKKMLHEITPKAIAVITEKMQKQFASEHHGSAYIDSIIRQLRKEIS